MRVNASVDFALRATLELARIPPGTYVPAVTIARAQGLSPNFLLSILHELRRAGMVESRRGADGGFRLSRPPEEIAVADVIRAVEGPLLSVRGEAPELLVYDGASEALREVWIALRASLRSVVEGVTIADLLAGSLPADVQRIAATPEARISR